MLWSKMFLCHSFKAISWLFFYDCDTKLIVILWPRILAKFWGVCHHYKSKDLQMADKWSSDYVLTHNLTLIANAIFQKLQTYLPSTRTTLSNHLFLIGTNPFISRAMNSLEIIKLIGFQKIWQTFNTRKDRKNYLWGCS